MARSSVGVPPRLAQSAGKAFRPRDLDDVYAQPRSEVARLVKIGAVRRLATGYYVLVPQRRLGDPLWRPDLHAAALGIAQVDYGVDSVALMGLSAARLHGAIPRELGVAVVSVPKQRPELRTDDGRVVFSRRRVEDLDVEATETELGRGWLTTVEQTMLDLASRPQLGGVEKQEVDEAILALAARADWTVAEKLAATQHRPSALRRARSATERRSVA